MSLFYKGAKPPDEDGMSKINEQMQKENKKSQMKIRVELQTTKYLVYRVVLKEKMSFI